MKTDFHPRALRTEFYLPTEVGPERLLVVLHGLGDSSKGFRFLPQMLKIPGLHYLLVNAPDEYFTGFSWFDLYGDAESGVRRSRDLVASVLDEALSVGWAAEDIGLFGFSQGCLMALDAACRYPQALGAIVGVSGFTAFQEEYPEKLSPAARQQKILVTHGTHDPLLPLEVTQGQVMALKGMGLQVKWKVYEKDHTIEPRQEVDDIRSFLQKHLVQRKAF